MAEYIDREAAVDAVTDIYYDTPGINLTAEKFEAAINGIPAADVAPVRHGRIGPAYMDEYYGPFADCKECGTDNILPCNYCRMCGCKMDRK